MTEHLVFISALSKGWNTKELQTKDIAIIIHTFTINGRLTLSILLGLPTSMALAFNGMSPMVVNVTGQEVNPEEPGEICKHKTSNIEMIFFLKTWQCDYISVFNIYIGPIKTGHQLNTLEPKCILCFVFFFTGKHCLNYFYFVSKPG